MKKRIKEVRVALGLSPSEFAKELGLEGGTIYSWERTGKIPDAKLKRIARAFRVNYDWLVSGKGSMFNDSEVDDESENDATIGLRERLKTLRKTLGMTQEEFADRLNVGGTSITGWEKTGQIPATKRQLIAKTYNVRLEWLETGEGAMFDKSKPTTIPAREYAMRHGCDATTAMLFERFMGLSSEKKRAFEGILNDLVDGLPSKGSSEVAIDSDASVIEEILKPKRGDDALDLSIKPSGVSTRSSGKTSQGQIIVTTGLFDCANDSEPDGR